MASGFYAEWRIEQAIQTSHQARAQALFAGAEVILAESNRHVPFLTGRFESTGATSVDADEGVAAISYDDTAFDGQAAWLHEDLSLHHAPGRTAKYLERAMNAKRAQVTAILQQYLERAVGQ
jgi:hypothetical protein